MKLITKDFYVFDVVKVTSKTAMVTGGIGKQVKREDVLVMDATPEQVDYAGATLDAMMRWDREYRDQRYNGRTKLMKPLKEGRMPVVEFTAPGFKVLE